MAKNNSNLTASPSKKEAAKEAKKYIKVVRNYLETKAGGELPPEWEMSIKMLEMTYALYLQVGYELQDMDTLLEQNRYGITVTPLLQAQTKLAARLEALMKELGISFKSAAKLNVVEPKKKKSALDKFLEGTMNKDVEVR